MKKILVTTDGSSNSDRALIEARKHAEASDGEITILTIVETLGRYTTVKKEVKTDDRKSKRILDSSLKIFDDFKGQVNTKIRRGNPADEIINEAESGEYDLLIMGSRGLGTFSRSILGAVSNKVVNHTKINVLVIK